MSTQITISNISGATFYNVWDDDKTLSEIPFAAGVITDAVEGEPYTITLPNTFSAQ